MAKESITVEDVKFWEKTSGKVTLAMAAAVLVAGGAWAYTAFVNPPEETMTAEEARTTLNDVDNLLKLPEKKRQRKLQAAGRAFSAEFGRNFRRAEGRPPDHRRGQQMRERMAKLSEADRAAFRKGMDEGRQRQMLLHQKEMQQKITKFFAASPAEQERILDQDIAEMEKRRAEWEKRRAEHEKNAPKGDNGNARGNNAHPGERGPGGDRPRHTPSKEQRENRMRGHLDNSSPTERAQRDEYFRRLRERRAATQAKK